MEIQDGITYEELLANIKSKSEEMLTNMESAGIDGKSNKGAARRARVASKRLEELLSKFRKMSN